MSVQPPNNLSQMSIFNRNDDQFTLEHTKKRSRGRESNVQMVVYKAAVENDNNLLIDSCKSIPLRECNSTAKSIDKNIGKFKYTQYQEDTLWETKAYFEDAKLEQYVSYPHYLFDHFITLEKGVLTNLASLKKLAREGKVAQQKYGKIFFCFSAQWHFSHISLLYRVYISQIC